MKLNFETENNEIHYTNRGNVTVIMICTSHVKFVIPCEGNRPKDHILIKFKQLGRCVINVVSHEIRRHAFLSIVHYKYSAEKNASM